MRRSKLWIVVLVIAAALVIWQKRGSDSPSNTQTVSQQPTSQTVADTQTQKPTPAASANSNAKQYPDYLPDEALETISLIEQDGPFPYSKDGSVFQNREKQLPKNPRGYYREYTVDTPGSRDRGARRIVTGGDPVETYCYTDDHYRSFRCFGAQP